MDEKKIIAAAGYVEETANRVHTMEPFALQSELKTLTILIENLVHAGFETTNADMKALIEKLEMLARRCVDCCLNRLAAIN